MAIPTNYNYTNYKSISKMATGNQRALCGVCSREVTVTSAGLVRVHGPLSNRCSGSRQAAQSPSPQPQPSEQDVVSPLAPSDSLQPPDSSARMPDLADTIAVLGQPCQTLRRIPKGSRDAVAAKLSTILENVTSSNSIEAWERLLLFPRRYVSLHAEPRRTKMVLGFPSQQAGRK